VKIESTKEGNLAMEATARTFRYLDDSEVAAQRKSATASKGGTAAKGGKR
jgi:type IV pilus assembly protein PilO